MAAMPVTHTAHAMKSGLPGFSDRSTTGTFHRTGVTFASMSGALAMNTAALAMNAAALAMNAAAFAMDACAFAMDCLSILRAQRCLARPMGIAYDPAKVEPVVVGNLAPALASLVHRYDVIEGQTRSIGSQRISEQVRVPQFTPAQPRRCPL